MSSASASSQISISDLPEDVQSYLVSFNSSRSNVKTLCLINSHWKQVVERHVKRRVWNLIHGHGNRGKDVLGRRRERSRLVFEAQRPIDTVTAKHALHFSHFTDSNHSSTSSKSSTLQVYFSFVPPPTSSLSDLNSRARSRSFSGAFDNNRSTSRSTNDSTSTSLIDQDQLSRPNNFNAPHDARNAIRGTMDQPFVPGVPEHYIEKMGEREVSSSVFHVDLDDDVAEMVSGSATPRNPEPEMKSSSSRGRSGFNESGSTSELVQNQNRRSNLNSSSSSSFDASISAPTSTSTSNHTDRIFTHVSRPLINNDITEVPDIGDDDMALDLLAQDGAEDGEDDPSTISDDDDAEATEEIQNSNSDNIRQPLDAYDWAGPATSVGSKVEPGASKRRPRIKIKPTYKFELDPLDSFETWILSLAIHKPHPASIWSMESHHSSSLYSQSLPPQIGGFRFMEGGGVESGPAIRLGPSNAIRGGMKWEKKVAEGLDRIYREWHLVDRFDDDDDDDQVESSRETSRNQSIESNAKGKGKGKSVEIPNSSKLNLKKMEKEKVKANLPIPSKRILEFDGDSSCVLEIQPHPVERVKLPSSFQSYDSGFGASYYSNYGNSSFPYGYGLSSNLNRNFEQDRTSLTFHCEEIRINAHRLLSTLEELEKREMDEMDKELERLGRRNSWINHGQFIVGSVANSVLNHF